MRRRHLSYSFLCILCCLIGVVLSLQCAVATPVIESSGAITIDWDAGAITLDSTFTTGWTSDALQADITLLLDQTGIDRFSASVGVCFRESLVLSANTVFDPLLATFTSAAFQATLPWHDADLSLSGLLEPGAFGSKIELTSTGDSIVRSLAVSFNLDEYANIQTTSCALPFTTAEVRFAIPLDCCESLVYANMRFDVDGFSECTISAPDVGGLPFGVAFSALLTFTEQEKTLQVSPSLSLENPDCFDFYTGLVWDATANTISGIRLYGMGMRSEIGDIRFRMLYCFDPSTLALIKSPYKALLGLVWPMVRCCEQASEGSLALFFGENNLFDLEEIVGELIAPVTEFLSLSLLVEYPMAGLPTFTFGWNYSSG